MSYLGVPPFGQTVRTVTTITATASQTSFTPTGGYTVGYCDVFYNGIKLVGGTDFTATDGLTVVLTTGATSGAVVEIITYGSVTITDAVRRSGDTFAGAVAINSTLAAGNTTITGNTTTTTLNSGNTAITGTLAAGNTAITGFANVTSTIQGGAGLMIAGAASGITTLAAGNTTITGFANVSSTLQVGANVVLGTTTISANGGVGTAGQVLTSGATSNVYWSTIASPGPAFSAYKSGNQSFSSNTWTKVTFPFEDYDTNNNFDSTTNYRFTPTVAGYYQINCTGYFTSGSSDNYLQLYKNGTSFGYYININASINNITLTFSNLFYMNGSSDYLELFVYSNAASPVVSSSGTHFQGFLARSA